MKKPRRHSISARLVVLFLFTALLLVVVVQLGFHFAFRTNLRPMWSALKRLGHRDEIRAWVEAGEPALSSGIVPLTRLGDWDTAYETPG